MLTIVFHIGPGCLVTAGSSHPPTRAYRLVVGVPEQVGSVPHGLRRHDVPVRWSSRVT